MRLLWDLQEMNGSKMEKINIKIIPNLSICSKKDNVLDIVLDRM